ncbi:MAG: tetratricopeptide repeat protein [Rhodothermales bacterium]|nr:tetratricopeptide repeat protein [Rhodothermales bacterium]
MSTLKPTRKVSRRHKVREDRVVTMSSRIIDTARENQSTVTLAAIAAIVLIAAYFGFQYYSGQQELKAADAVAASVQAYEDGRFREALVGVAGSTGLVGIIDKYGSTPTGNLARFYAGDAHFRLGQYEEALEYFSDYDKSRDYLGASAYAGEAAVHESRGDFARAASLYERAADAFESEVTTPQYLFDAAVAHEQAGDFAKSKRVLTSIKDEYPSSPAATDSELVMARVDAKAANS